MIVAVAAVRRLRPADSKVFDAVGARSLGCALPPAITEDQIMDRNIEAAVGGSDRGRTSGGRFAIIVKAEGVRRLSSGQAPRALARAGARAAAR
jgi:hypothetical protein